jgi:hypothetical protein
MSEHPSTPCRPWSRLADHPNLRAAVGPTPCNEICARSAAIRVLRQSSRMSRLWASAGRPRRAVGGRERPWPQRQCWLRAACSWAGCWWHCPAGWVKSQSFPLSGAGPGALVHGDDVSAAIAGSQSQRMPTGTMTTLATRVRSGKLLTLGGGCRRGLRRLRPSCTSRRRWPGPGRVP